MLERLQDKILGYTNTILVSYHNISSIERKQT